VTATAPALLDAATGVACVVTDVILEAEVVALDVSVRVRQHFSNPMDHPIEAVYVFPLPPLAAVTAMRATLGGRTIVAKLAERSQARTEYARAIASGQRAALAEEERPSTFTMTVGNLGAGETAEVELELVGPVEVQPRVDASDVLVAWDAVLRLPTVVAPRYTEGEPERTARTGAGTAPDTDRVPDASRVTPPVGVGVGPQVQWCVRIDAANLPVGVIEAPEGTDRTPEDGGLIRLEGRGRADQDVTVRWTLAPKEIALAATAVHDDSVVADRDGDTTVSVTIVPPVGLRARQAADVVIVLDRSGSMGGWKMGTAVRAAARLIDTLPASDSAALITFDNEVEGDRRLVPVTAAAREEFHRRLDQVTARGGTELGAAVIAASQALGPDDRTRQRVILLITDGQVSGESAAVAAAEASGARVVVVGVDVAVNHGLLDRLARATAGSATVVSNPSELEASLAVTRRRLGTPALERVQVQVDGAVLGSLAGDHRDLVWPDSVARFGLRASRRTNGPVPVTLVADGPSGSWRATLDATTVTTPTGRHTWARARLRALEDDYDTGGDLEPAQIVRHSLAYGVLSRFTAFVAVDEHGGQVGDGTPPLTVVQPSELPQGWAVPMRAALAGAPDHRWAVDAMTTKTGPASQVARVKAPRLPLGSMRSLNPRATPPSTPTAPSAATGELVERLLAVLRGLGCVIVGAAEGKLSILAPNGHGLPLGTVDVESGRVELQSGSWPIAEGLGLSASAERRKAGDKAVVQLRSGADVTAVERLVAALLRERGEA